MQLILSETALALLTRVQGMEVVTGAQQYNERRLRLTTFRALLSSNLSDSNWLRRERFTPPDNLDQKERIMAKGQARSDVAGDDTRAGLRQAGHLLIAAMACQTHSAADINSGTNHWLKLVSASEQVDSLNSPTVLHSENTLRMSAIMSLPQLQPTQMAVTLQQIRHRNDTVFVPINEVRSGPWSANLQFLATEGLNGCTAVAVMSEYGAILAHIAPRTSTRNGDQNVRDLMAEVVCHSSLGRAAGLFPHATGVVLAAVHENEVALPDAVRVIKAVLERLGVPVRFEKYRVRGQGEVRASGETSFIIHGGRGKTPQTYVNDCQLH